MVTEDYVSFETAKLLKEKGFDEDCRYFYDYEKPKSGYLSNERYGERIHNSNDYEGRELAACPTLQMAMKWLIETHKLHIEPTPYPHEDGVFYWAYKIAFLDSDTLAVMVVRKKAGFDSKEKACEAAIKYCLENLI